MSKKYDTPITRKKFMQELSRYKRGSITRRHFLGATGLGLATAVMGAAVPALLPRKTNLRKAEAARVKAQVKEQRVPRKGAQTPRHQTLY